MRQVKTVIFFIISLVLPVLSLAAVPTWKLVDNESSLTFTATQNGAPVTGEFKKFTATINFDPVQLDHNNVKVVVDTTSIADPYNQLSDTLKGADWFNVKQYPQATFTATSFSKTGDKTYQANGSVTIRDKTLPVILTFTQRNSHRY